jgi:nicotinamidase/pyrazinamidase
MNQKTLFWDVDTQRDFIDPGGRLAVPGASEILPNLERLTQFAVEQGIPILASADAHVEDDEELEQFPPHCLAGTPGQEKMPETTATGAQVADLTTLEEQTRALAAGRTPQLIVQKRELDVFSEPAAERILSALDPERIVVYGVATEYCVYEAVMALIKRDHRPQVVEDAIRAVNDDAGRKAIKEMHDLGAVFLDTKAVLAQ